MRDGYQTVCEKVGKWGCYALSLVHIAQATGTTISDPVSEIWVGMKRGFINKDDCSLLDPAGFLSMLTGRKWSIVIEHDTHKLPVKRPLQQGEWAVKEWFNPRTQLTHFTTEGYDGLVDSVTVKEGSVRSLRVFKRC